MYLCVLLKLLNEWGAKLFLCFQRFCFVAKAEREAAAEASGVQGLISESVEQRNCVVTMLRTCGLGAMA
jgi:hypothetical protein